MELNNDIKIQIIELENIQVASQLMIHLQYASKKYN